jgi:hypothetical protein
MSFPIHDWQFWLVTLIATFALAYLVRKLLPDRLKPWRKGPRGKSTSLTIGGKAVEQPRKS